MPAEYSNVIGYRHDILFDNLDIPFIPIGSLLKRENPFFDTMEIGMARPEGYLGMVGTLFGSDTAQNNISRHLRSYFTGIKYLPDESCSIRYLKENQTFYADVNFPEEAEREAAGNLKKVKTIGAVTEGISGRVEMSLSDEETEIKRKLALNPLCEYAAVDYSVMFLTPAAISNPYADGPKTYDYLQGALIRAALKKYCDLDSLPDSRDLFFSNAYISSGGRRFYPAPLCLSVVKLDRDQLRYRLSSGKDPRRVEQDLGLGGTYAADVTEHCVKYMSPQTCIVSMINETKVDALITGQSFSGTITGSDSLIRRIAGMLNDNPIIYLGDHNDQGLGEAFIVVDRVREKPLQTEKYAKCFDVCCESETLLLNDEGMPTCEASALLGEIEYTLGAPGKLEIVGQYTDTSSDFSIDYETGLERPVVRCLARGSIIRVKTIDDVPIDISPILHCLIGERTKDGYGEIITYDAVECYYRLAENISPELYAYKIPMSCKMLSIRSNIVRHVLTGILRQRITSLGHIDREEYLNGASPEDLAAVEVMEFLRDKYNIFTTDEELKQWYLRGIEGKDYD